MSAPLVSYPVAQPERPGFLLSLPGVMSVVAAYAMVHTTLRLGSSGNLGDDDPLDNLLVQTLAPGYSLQEGPLYSWMLWLVQHVMGTGLPSFLLLKYTMLVGMAAGIFLITRRITGSALWAFIAVESMVTVYQIFWRFHEGFTNRVAAMTLAIATFWAWIRLLDHDRPRDRWLLGTLVGLGLLTEHAYAAFLLALLVASATQTTVRQRLFRQRHWTVLPVAAFIVCPYAAWWLQHVPDLASWSHLNTSEHTLLAMGRGVRDALTFPLMVLSPYIFVVPLVFPGVLRHLFKRHANAQEGQPDFMRLLSDLLALELIYLVVKDALLFPRSDYAVHSLLPMFILGIVWMTAKIQASAPTQRQIKAFLIVMAAFTVVAFTVRSGNLYMNEPFCSRCRWGVPYPELAQQLHSEGFHGGTVVTDDPHIAGNLRRFFPDSRFVLVGHKIPFKPAPTEQTAVVWFGGDNSTAPDTLKPYLPSDGFKPQTVVLPWQHLWRSTGYRESSWQVFLQNGSL